MGNEAPRSVGSHYERMETPQPQMLQSTYKNKYQNPYNRIEATPSDSIKSMKRSIVSAQK